MKETVWALVSAAASALGPTYGGIVNQTLGWRYIFVLLVSVLIITLILGIATIEEKHEPEKVPVDIWGIIFIMLTFLGLVYGFVNIAAFFLINAIMLGTSFLLPNYLQVALLCESMIAGHPNNPKIMIGSRIIFRIAPMIREIMDNTVSPTACNRH